MNTEAAKSHHKLIKAHISNLNKAIMDASMDGLEVIVDQEYLSLTDSNYDIPKMLVSVKLDTSDLS